ncbi:MAG: hypothetical protein LBI61_00915 [Puniceicoccales bacterium]|nr:hypothetical protein [Puniceicoccales bacterium]
MEEFKAFVEASSGHSLITSSHFKLLAKDEVGSKLLSFRVSADGRSLFIFEGILALLPVNEQALSFYTMALKNNPDAIFERPHGKPSFIDRVFNYAPHERRVVFFRNLEKKISNDEISDATKERYAAWLHGVTAGLS